jgi:hypothetical protein
MQVVLVTTLLRVSNMFLVEFFHLALSQKSVQYTYGDQTEDTRIP